MVGGELRAPADWQSGWSGLIGPKKRGAALGSAGEQELTADTCPNGERGTKKAECPRSNERRRPVIPQ